MSFFKKLFGGDSEGDGAAKTAGVAQKQGGKKNTRQFGRYTDCNKDGFQLDSWNKATKAFGEKRYVDSFESFFNYLNDRSLNNVQFERNGESISFELIQGSKRLTGKADANEFTAEASIAVMEGQSIPVMRKLMSINYGLKYSKFALNENVLCMKFSSHAIDASPNKLYAGLKELAKKADQQDDLLISEFSSLQEVDTDHIISINAEHQNIRYETLMQMIQDTKAELAKLDHDKMSGGISFLLLDLTYKIDYLITPQGLLTDALEKIQQIFFEKSNATTAERNTRIIAEYERLLAEPKEKILDGIYDVECTFGIANAATHKTVMDMMFKEREKVAWYRDNGYPQIAESVYGYMVSYAFFNYGMVFPVTGILNIAMHVLNPAFYQKMGDRNGFVNADKTLNSKAIQHAIREVVSNAKSTYPNIQFNTTGLRYGNPSQFIDSLIVELDKIDLRKK